VHVLKPEIENTQPKVPRDERPSDHKALSGAAELAIEQGDLDFLGLLFKKGLLVNEALNFEDGDTLLHVATSWGKLDIVKFLLEVGADPTIRNHYGDRPIDTAISDKEEDLSALLARPDDEEAMVDGIPSGLIEAILPNRTQNEIIFISWNRANPGPELLAEIRKTVPNARPASRKKTLDRRPLGAHSWYQDTESKEFGTLIEVSLDNEGEIWTAAVRRSVGPVMAGGGWKGKARKRYGYWHTYDVNGWDE
jgi:ankyrin repeat protein